MRVFGELNLERDGEIAACGCNIDLATGVIEPDIQMDGAIPTRAFVVYRGAEFEADTGADLPRLRALPEMRRAAGMASTS